MKNLYYSICIVTLYAIAACTTDEFESMYGELPFPNKVRNENGAQLLHLMNAQTGSYERFEELLNSCQPLFEYTDLSYGANGLLFSVPYTDANHNVEGYIAYPVDETLPLKERKANGTLGTPRKIDAVNLTEIPITQRYLYAVPFARWEEQGLNIPNELTAPVRMLSTPQIIRNEAVDTRAFGEVIPILGYNSGNEIVFEASMQQHNITSSDLWGVTVTAMDLSSLSSDMVTFLRTALPGNLQGELIGAAFDVGHISGTILLNKQIALQDAELLMDGFFNFFEQTWKYAQFGLSFQYNAYLTGNPSYGYGGGGIIIGGGGGYGGGGGGSQDGNGSGTPYVDGIIETCTLSKEETALLEKCIKESLEHDDYINEIYEYLKEKNYKFDEVRFRDESKLGNAALAIGRDAQGNITSKILEIDKNFTFDFFSHELTHLFQAEQGAFNSKENAGMTEYERNMMDDIIFYASYNGNTTDLPYEAWKQKLYSILGDNFKDFSDQGEKGEWKEQRREYATWLSRITQKGIPEKISDEDFQQWTSFYFKYDRNYNNYKPNEQYSPTALNTILKLMKNR